MPVIGYLHSASPEPYSPMIAAFRQGLAEAGYVDGRDVTIDYRCAEGQFNRLPALAAELVARRPAILVAGGGDVSAVAAKSATTTVPIVFTIGADPVGSGLVSNLSRPSGNLTGVTFFTITLGPKRLELLRELLPKAGKSMARARDKRYGCLRRRSCENSAGRGLFRSLVRIDHIARLVLGRHKHDLGRDVLELAEIVTLDMLELELQHARLRPLA
jgi:hypothetical protein